MSSMTRSRRSSLEVTSSAVRDFISRATDQALQAQSLQDFLQGVRQGIGYLREEVGLAPGKDSPALLDEAFESLRQDMRRRRILELCAWPLYDKVAVPAQAPASKEMLGLFTLPFVVQLSSRHLGKTLLLEQNAIDPNALLEIVEGFGHDVPQDGLRCFSTLLRREDVHACGPKNISQAFVEGETSGEAGLQPLPCFFDEEIESYRAFTVLVPCAVRMPSDATRLFESRQGWPARRAAQLMRSSLEQAGLHADLLLSLPPLSFTESLFMCSGAGLAELEVNLIEAKHLYGPLTVALKHPAPGYAEITAVDDAGEELFIVPPFSFFEPKKALEKAVRGICAVHGLEFSGSYGWQTPSSALLH